ncbi:MAG: CPBP family intramembrane glutamic endopeptidase, partial [Myxococcota bacterium]
LHVDPRLAGGGSAGAAGGLLGAVVMSLGAGFHEELVFRQGLFPALGALSTRAGLGPRVATLLAALVSSAIFAAAHHVGPLGEPWRAGAIVYRTLAGLFFVALFQWRGLCVAAWSHALYDIYVIAVRG